MRLVDAWGSLCSVDATGRHPSVQHQRERVAEVSKSGEDGGAGRDRDGRPGWRARRGVSAPSLPAPPRTHASLSTAGTTPNRSRFLRPINTRTALGSYGMHTQGAYYHPRDGVTLDGASGSHGQVSGLAPHSFTPAVPCFPPRYSRLEQEGAEGAAEDKIKIKIKTLDDSKSWEVNPRTPLAPSALTSE